MSADLSTWRDLLLAAFSAGGAWTIVRQMRKEVNELRRELNGVGARQRKFEANAKALALALLDKREDRDKIALFFRE